MRTRIPEIDSQHQAEPEEGELGSRATDKEFGWQNGNKDNIEPILPKISFGGEIPTQLARI